MKSGDRTRLRGWLGAALVSLLAACSQQQMLEKFSTPADQAEARGYIDDLRAGRFEHIESVADPSISKGQMRDTLQRMAQTLPQGEPSSVKLVGAQRNTMVSLGSQRDATINSVFEYGFGDRWFLLNVMMRDRDGVRTIVGLHVNVLAQSLESLNAFTLVGKGASQYFALAASITAVLLSLSALVACIRTPLRRRKWAWILFIVFGFGKFTLNWTTGQWSFMPVSVQLFSASAMAPFYGPWIVAFSLPVGAVVFLVRRRMLMRPPETAIP